MLKEYCKLENMMGGPKEQIDYFDPKKTNYCSELSKEYFEPGDVTYSQQLPKEYLKFEDMDHALGVEKEFLDQKKVEYYSGYSKEYFEDFKYSPPLSSEPLGSQGSQSTVLKDEISADIKEEHSSLKETGVELGKDFLQTDNTRLQDSPSFRALQLCRKMNFVSAPSGTISEAMTRNPPPQSRILEKMQETNKEKRKQKKRKQEKKRRNKKREIRNRPLVLGEIGPSWSSNWARANWAPAYLAPGKFCSDKLGPWKMSERQIGPRQIWLLENVGTANWAQNVRNTVVKLK